MVSGQWVGGSVVGGFNKPDVFFVVLVVTSRSCKLRKVLNSLLLKHCKNVHIRRGSVITTFN